MLTALPPRPAGSSVAAVLGASGNGLYVSFAPRGGRIIGVALAIALSMGYWVVNSLALSFAKADLLPPLLAAWAANVVFAGLGISLFLRART